MIDSDIVRTPAPHRARTSGPRHADEIHQRANDNVQRRHGNGHFQTRLLTSIPIE
ncbi:hypothetical protein BN2497_1409 [Janthinobacterium sp. CG23_2]|nr:hypothetical protein BN2497_1409 [Janthinobacterium sp. CG23_2]CUU27102.1 hypothetical protein BN3177_1409 [Janthinobacterium sp. CG23_2]